ncbi:MAG: hypothetical protein MZV70_40880 [Desulfobacterales bacterium]|nr:hypothetical protein [Desulfobacterales bacterium]
MLTTGFLEAFIPEFQRVSNRIQYDEYHLYPVDKHLLRTVQTIKQLAADGRPAEPLFARDLPRAEEQGRCWPGPRCCTTSARATTDEDHSEQRRRSGPPHPRGERASRRRRSRRSRFSCASTCILIKTATRRDIHDEETAIVCARRIKDPERLKMLYLLTVADSMATGPAAWNDWTSHLLREFFLKVLNVLEQGELASDKAVGRRSSASARPLLAAAGSDAERRGAGGSVPGACSPRYLLSVPAEDIAGAHRAVPAAGRAPISSGTSSPPPRAATRTGDHLRQGPSRA